MIDARPGCDVPPELEAVVRSALAILPEDRIDSADELARRLETIRILISVGVLGHVGRTSDAKATDTGGGEAG